MVEGAGGGESTESGLRAVFLLWPRSPDQSLNDAPTSLCKRRGIDEDAATIALAKRVSIVAHKTPPCQFDKAADGKAAEEHPRRPQNNESASVGAGGGCLTSEVTNLR